MVQGEIHTDRPVRDENDDEHIFHSPEKMDELLKKYEPLAYTEWFDEALNRPIGTVFLVMIFVKTLLMYM